MFYLLPSFCSEKSSRIVLKSNYLASVNITYYWYILMYIPLLGAAGAYIYHLYKYAKKQLL